MHLHELCDVVVAVASCVGVRGRKRREERGDETRRSFGLGVACDINHCILRPRVLVVVVSRDSLAPLVAKSPTSFCWWWWRRWWLFLSLSLPSPDGRLIALAQQQEPLSFLLIFVPFLLLLLLMVVFFFLFFFVLLPLLLLS